MLEHMDAEGLERAYAIIQRLWLRHDTGTRTHTPVPTKTKARP